MNGQIADAELGLDYRHYVAPLTVDKINDDLNDIRAEKSHEIDFIIMWEHQWDWILKQTANEYDVKAWGINNLHITARWSGRGKNSFMGVPVRLP